MNAATLTTPDAEATAWHALDHLAELEDDLTRDLPTAGDWQHSPAFPAGVRALAAWLDATNDPEAEPAPAVFEALEGASKELSAGRKAGREKLLADVALQRAPAAAARAGLDTLAWANGAVYHTWRLAESLRIASGK